MYCNSHRKLATNAISGEREGAEREGEEEEEEEEA